MSREDEIRERLAAVTDGPWRAVCLGSEGYSVWTDADGMTLRERRGSVAVSTQRPFEECKADAELIAHAPDDLAWLLAELAAARVIPPLPEDAK